MFGIKTSGSKDFNHPGLFLLTANNQGLPN
jgi:hypothetical protein